jgi:hypothetical protein
VPDALSIKIGKALVDEVNGHTWQQEPEAFTAERVYFARYKKDDLATMRVSVLALTHADQRVTRTSQQADLTFWLDVQKMLENHADVDEVDGLVNFLAEIKTFYSDGHRLPAPFADWWVESAEYFQDQFWDPQRLYVDHVYEAAVQLTVRGQM